MARVISWMAYVWLIASEAFEEMVFANTVDSMRRFVRSDDCRRQAPKVKQSVPSISPMR